MNTVDSTGEFKYLKSTNRGYVIMQDELKHREDGHTEDSMACSGMMCAEETGLQKMGAEKTGVQYGRSETPPIIHIETSSARFFEVRLDLFDGPIDLLLHLVKQNELPLEKISLAQIAMQYVECLEAMRQLDLEVAGEYLVIAATLLSIKSSVLLHQPVQLVEDADGKILDPHEELLRRLREAEIYQDGARALGGKNLLDIDVFEGAPHFASDGNGASAAPEVRFKPHDAMLLALAFRKLLARAGDDPTYAISIEHVSIVERMVAVMGVLQERGGSALFEELVPHPLTRAGLVATFLSLLELCKRQVIAVAQDEMFTAIRVALRSSEQGAEVGFGESELTSEFDDAAQESGQAAVNK